MLIISHLRNRNFRRIEVAIQIESYTITSISAIPPVRIFIVNFCIYLILKSFGSDYKICTFINTASSNFRENIYKAAYRRYAGKLYRNIFLCLQLSEGVPAQNPVDGIQEVFGNIVGRGLFL